MFLIESIFVQNLSLSHFTERSFKRFIILYYIYNRSELSDLTYRIYWMVDGKKDFFNNKNSFQNSSPDFSELNGTVSG